MRLSASGELAQANRGEQGVADLAVRGIQAASRQVAKASGPTVFDTKADATLLQSMLQLVV